MNLYYNKYDRSTVRRRAGRARYDRATVDAILDHGLVGHVAVIDQGWPYSIPMLYARHPGEDIVYLHGSPLSRLLKGLAGGWPMCLTVTLVDGLVLARSAFHHSVNFRSATVFGTGHPVRGRAEKLEALRIVVEHVISGRSDDVRGPSDKELAATEVIALAIEEASAKIRTGPPVDAPEDLSLPVWAGEVPLTLMPGVPKPDAQSREPVPSYLESWSHA